MMFDIQQRDVPNQLVVSDLRHHLRQPELPDHLGAAVPRLRKLADEHGGGVAGLPFAVFHDKEHDPQDITLEVCVPIHDAPEGLDDAVVRVEPAHREAFVRLTKAQVEPATLDAAYRAVFGWVDEQGLTATGGAREIYLIDFPLAEPEDHVFDIAVPVS
jgi:effector-binding domain-containing protein